MPTGAPIFVIHAVFPFQKRKWWSSIALVLLTRRSSVHPWDTLLYSNLAWNSNLPCLDDFDSNLHVDSNQSNQKKRSKSRKSGKYGKNFGKTSESYPCHPGTQGNFLMIMMTARRVSRWSWPSGASCWVSGWAWRIWSENIVPLYPWAIHVNSMAMTQEPIYWRYLPYIRPMFQG